MSLRTSTLRESLLRRTASVDHIIASSVAVPPPCPSRVREPQRQYSAWLASSRTRSSSSRNIRLDKSIAEDAQTAALDASLEACFVRCPLQCPPPPRSWMVSERSVSRERTNNRSKSASDHRSKSLHRQVGKETPTDLPKDTQVRPSPDSRKASPRIHNSPRRSEKRPMINQRASPASLQHPDRPTHRQAAAQKVFGKCHPTSLARRISVFDAAESVDNEVLKSMSSCIQSPRTSDDWVTSELEAELHRRQQALMEKEQALEILRKENEKLRATAENGWNAAQLFYHALHTRTEDTEVETDKALNNNVDVASATDDPLESCCEKTDEKEHLAEDTATSVNVRFASSSEQESVDSGERTTAAQIVPSSNLNQTNSGDGSPSSPSRRVAKSMVAQICADFENRLQQIWDGAENGAPAPRRPLTENSSVHHTSQRGSPHSGSRLNSDKSDCGLGGHHARIP